MKALKRYFAEFFVIIISVLVAFWVDEYRENLNDSREVREAVRALYSEIKRNQSNLEKNAAFYSRITGALKLNEKYGTGNFLIKISEVKLDSVLQNNSSIQVRKVKCLDNSECIYQLELNFNRVPEIPITNNIWNSIKSSQIASKIDIKLLATASNFYDSWVYTTISDLIINYNNSFIGEGGDFDSIPDFTLFYRFDTLREIALSNYETSLPEFEELAAGMVEN